MAREEELALSCSDLDLFNARDRRPGFAAIMFASNALNFIP